MIRSLAALIAVTATAAPVAQGAAPGTPDNHSATPVTLGVIGDTPYGTNQLENFPRDVAEINADPKVRLVMHLGDVKNGSSRCDDSYFELIRSHFDAFADPLVYTPGDNEWTDCHRASNGGYLPAGAADARLETLRSVFFDSPGQTLGRRSKPVRSQAAPFVENVRWSQSRTVFATLHVVGSNNDLLPWFGAAETPQQQALRLLEYETRLTADLDWLDETFDAAEAREAAAVVLAMQADTWDSFAIAAGQVDGFEPIIDELADRARAFGRPVLLLQGDSHMYLSDRPLAAGSAVYGVTEAVPNLTRIVVQGSTSVPHEWLRLRIDPRTAGVFSWERVPFTG